MTHQARLHGRDYHAFTDTRRPGNGPSLAHFLFHRADPSTPRPSPAGSASASFVEGEREKGLREGLRKKKKKLEKLSADMIKRVDVPVRINEMSVSGWLGENRSGSERANSTGAQGNDRKIGQGGEPLPEVFADDESAVEDPVTREVNAINAQTENADIKRQPSVSGRT